MYWYLQKCMSVQQWHFKSVTTGYVVLKYFDVIFQQKTEF